MADEARAGTSGLAYRTLWTANAFSNLGDGLYQFALPLLAFSTTQSPALVAGVTVALTLAWPLFGLHAGAIVDRFDRRSILLVVSGIRLAVLAGLTVSIAGGWLSLPVVYVAAITLGMAETLADTSLTSLVPAVVGRSDLNRANGQIVAGQTVANSFIGPPLAGALFGIGAATLSSVATVLYAVTAAALVLLRRMPLLATTPATQSSGGAVPAPRPAANAGLGVTAGFRFLWRHPLLRRLTLFTAAMNVWWASFYALIVVYAVAPGPMGLTPADLGLLLTVMAVGGVVGSLVTERLVQAIGLRTTLTLDVAGTIILLGTPALTTEPVAVGLAMALAGFASAAWVVLVSSIRQRLTPDALLGRAYSASRLISWGVLPISAAAAGIAAEFVGVRTVFATGAVVSIGLLAAFLLAVSAERLETGTVIPEPEAEAA